MKYPATPLRVIFPLLFATLAVAGCGGGGGGGSSFSDSSIIGGDGADASTSTDVGIRAVSFDSARTTAAATSTPTEGSVVQSSGSGGIEITTVDLDATHVDTEDAPEGTFNITRGDDDFSIPLDSVIDVLPLVDLQPDIADAADDPSDDFYALPGDYDFVHPEAEDSRHFDYVQLGKDDRTAFATFATDFSSQFGGDNYLAFGVWAYSPTGIDADAEIGAFADGIEYLSVDGHELPTDVEARYIGKTVGIYSKSDGEIGTVLGDVDLGVVFYGAGTGASSDNLGQIAGGVNTIYLAPNHDLANAELLGEMATDENGIDYVRSKYWINFESKIFDSDTGFFIGTSRFCNPDCRSPRGDGQWGGQFFGAAETYSDAESGRTFDVPARIAGTWGVLAEDFEAVAGYGTWLDPGYPPRQRTGSEPDPQPESASAPPAS